MVASNITTAIGEPGNHNNIFGLSGDPWSWNLNEILVFITWIIFALVTFATAIAGLFRPDSSRRKSMQNDAAALDADNLLGGGTESKEGDLERGYIRGKKTGDGDSDVSSILGAHLGLGENLETIEAGAESVEHTPDNVLCETLKAVLAKGMKMTLYTVDGPKKIKMFLVGMELRWRTVKIISRKTYKVDLRNVDYLEWGKRTAAFQSDAARVLDEELCFSLVSPSKTVDLQASSKVERDAVAQGFVLLLEEIARESGRNAK